MTREEKLQKIYEVIKPTEFAKYRDDEDEDGEVIEHVMIWDVLDRIVSKEDRTKYEQLSEDFRVICWDIDILNTVWLRGSLRKPIDSQSEKCIDYVLSLIESVE